MPSRERGRSPRPLSALSKMAEGFKEELARMAAAYDNLLALHKKEQERLAVLFTTLRNRLAQEAPPGRLSIRKRLLTMLAPHRMLRQEAADTWATALLAVAVRINAHQFEKYHAPATATTISTGAI